MCRVINRTVVSRSRRHTQPKHSNTHTPGMFLCCDETKTKPESHIRLLQERGTLTNTEQIGIYTIVQFTQQPLTSGSQSHTHSHTPVHTVTSHHTLINTNTHQHTLINTNTHQHTYIHCHTLTHTSTHCHKPSHNNTY